MEITPFHLQIFSVLLYSQVGDVEEQVGIEQGSASADPSAEQNEE